MSRTSWCLRMVRKLASHFERLGGVPLCAVFDRPKTVALRWGEVGVVTEWNPTFAYAALELGFTAEVCWPYQPRQKGSVENLVGWVKGSFFKQRRFHDREDLAAQLAQCFGRSTPNGRLRLPRASSKGRLREALSAYLQPHVLVIDEVGYLSYGPYAANVLFHVVNLRHLRHRPMVFTTNKSPLTVWGEVLHDHNLAEAIVDRVLEKGRLLLVDGSSYRTRHLKLDNTDQHGKDVARVS